MASVTEIQEGISNLRRMQALVGKKGSRLHEETAAKNADRLRVLLLGPCRDCISLKVEFETIPAHGRGTVLRCKLGHSPLNLAQNTPIGEKMMCDSFSLSR